MLCLPNTSLLGDTTLAWILGSIQASLCAARTRDMPPRRRFLQSSILIVSRKSTGMGKARVL